MKKLFIILSFLILPLLLTSCYCSCGGSSPCGQLYKTQINGTSITANPITTSDYSVHNVNISVSGTTVSVTFQITTSSDVYPGKGIYVALLYSGMTVNNTTLEYVYIVANSAREFSTSFTVSNAMASNPKAFSINVILDGKKK